jgi:hypothetical protein
MIYILIKKKGSKGIKRGVVMKSCRALLIVVCCASYGLFVSAAQYTNGPRRAPNVYPYAPIAGINSYRDTTEYPIIITTSGDNAIVNGIKQRSDITQADESRWGFSWIPIVGSSISSGMIAKVRNFMRVCRGSVLAKGWFNSTDVLMTHFVGRKPIAVCNALNNLDQQGEYALALLGRFGTTVEQGLYSDELLQFIKNIQVNRQLMSNMCGSIAQQKIYEEQQKLQQEHNKLEYNKNWWKMNQLRWQMAKDMGTTAFNSAKWLAQAANEYKGTLASGAIMLFVYDRLFGISRPPVAK